MEAGNAFSIVDRLVQLLPQSPFRPYLEQFASLPFLGMLNWFFPVSECLAVLGTWLVAISLYLLYSVIMRWVKVIS